MFFSKEVCKRCSEIHCGKWGADEEFDWDELGLVECFIQPPPLSYTNINLSDGPPSKCPYKLEHIVMEEEEEYES